MKFTIRTGMLVAATILHTLLTHRPADAVPLPSDMSISGSVAFDDSYASIKTSGNVKTQSGSFYIRQGGADSTSTFNGSTASGTNPRIGTLTDLGDGFGITANVGSSYLSTFGLGNNIIVNLANNSSTLSYTVRFTVDFLNNPNVTGDDSFAHSNYYIRDTSNKDIFYTDITRDTVIGDKTYSLPDNFFNLTLAPNSSTQLNGYWTLDGGVFADSGTAAVEFEAFLGIGEINSSGVSPSAVPEPGTVILVGAGLAALGMLRRRIR